MFSAKKAFGVRGLSLAMVLAAGALGAFPGTSMAGRVALSSGWGPEGQLGDGLSGNRYIPFETPLPGEPAEVSNDYYYTLTLQRDGTVAAYGYNKYGELGDGTKTEHRSPIVIPGLTGVKAVQAGYEHGMALMNDGTVRAWGSNAKGQLGLGATAESLVPQTIPGLEHVKAIASGCYASYALLADGTVEAWGYNNNGEVGDGTTETKKTPVPIAGLSEVTAISGGCDWAMALKSNGTVEAWGYGGFGEMGSGAVGTPQKAPLQVSGLSGVSAISAGGSFGLALLGNGTVDAWGYNYYNELGIGSNKEDESVQPVPGLAGVSSISAGGYFSLALLTNGTVEGWGYNEEGETGNGTSATLPSPVPTLYPHAALALGRGGAYSYTSSVIEGSTATASTSSLAFAGEAVGGTGTPQAVVFTNQGPAALSISGDTLAGAGAGSFTKASDTCQGATLAAGASCTVAYSSTPKTPGAQSASVSLSAADAPFLPSVALSGTGLSPTLGALRLSSSTLRASHSGASAVAASSTTGTDVIYTDSLASTTTFEVSQSSRGVFSGTGSKRRCAKAPKHPAKHAKSCTFLRSLGSFTHLDEAGTNVFRFTGRVAGHTLGPGSYRLSAVARTGSAASATRSVAFKITR